MAFYRHFGKILEGYNYPRGSSGMINYTDFDFQKFIGHELFVTFFSSLIAQERWDICAELLEQQIYVNNVDGDRQDLVPFTYASEYVRLLNETRNRRLGLNKLSVQAELLKLRHTQGDLGNINSLQQFIDADLFRHPRAEMPRETSATEVTWCPWSIFHMKELPKYLIEARRAKFAVELCLSSWCGKYS